MKKILIFLFCFHAFICDAQKLPTDYKLDDLVGEWFYELESTVDSTSKKVNTNSGYSITIIVKKEKGKYIGYVCGVKGYAAKYDSCYPYGPVNAVFKHLNNEIICDFFSCYSQSEANPAYDAKGKIVFISKNIIKWDIIKDPKGVFYIPRKAVLTKIK